MKYCTQCGHVLGPGRFCTNCGHEARAADETQVARPESTDWRETTAERPSTENAPPPRTDEEADEEAEAAPAPDVPAPPAAGVPPAAMEPPPPPRFPLYADEVGGPSGPGSAPAAATEVFGAVDDGEPGHHEHGHDGHGHDDEHDCAVSDWDEHDWDEHPEDLDDAEEHGGEGDGWTDEWDEYPRRRRLPRILAAIVVLALLVAGGWRLGRVMGGGDADPPSDSTDAAALVDVTSQAAIRAPRTAPPTEGPDGEPVSYDAANMLDGDPETAWRAAGDRSKMKIVLTFEEPTEIAEVGLINGYARTSTDDSGETVDFYAGHRRITAVTWTFAAGAVVRQELEETTDLQSIEVDPVTTRKVVLKIIATTPPGEGPDRRDYTAISGVRLAG